MLLCRDSALCLSVHAVPGFLGTWLPNIYWLHRSLALGCPTLRSGTWLPNSTPFSTLRHVTSWHNCAQRAFRSICCTYYLISLDELHLGCDTLRHLLFIRSDGYMWYIMDIWYLVYMFWFHCLCIHCSLWRLLPCTLLLYAREFIGTPVRPDFSMFHSVSVCWLCYWSAPYMISLCYSITWWNRYYRYAARSIEPPVIRWLFGPHVSGDLTYDDSVPYSHSSTVIFTLVHSYYPVCLTWNVLMMSCRPRVIQFLFSVTYCYYDDKLLYCRSVGAAFPISMDIVILIRCWLYWTMIW